MELIVLAELWAQTAAACIFDFPSRYSRGTHEVMIAGFQKKQQLKIEDTFLGKPYVGRIEDLGNDLVYISTISNFGIDFVYFSPRNKNLYFEVNSESLAKYGKAGWRYSPLPSESYIRSVVEFCDLR